ncbi:MAG: preprotein translocase subunit YajC [Akkermansiaceae bacterium]|nr:preprotein translocase subunit YajC [Akkermansiaceae bacterium]
MISLSTFFIFAQQAQPNPLGSMIIPIAVMFVMIYFLMIRPQQKQRKEQMERINALQNGDKVVTTAGIHGIVHNIKDKTVSIKVAEGTMIEFDKMAITQVTKKD